MNNSEEPSALNQSFADTGLSLPRWHFFSSSLPLIKRLCCLSHIHHRPTRSRARCLSPPHALSSSRPTRLPPTPFRAPPPSATTAQSRAPYRMKGPASIGWPRAGSASASPTVAAPSMTQRGCHNAPSPSLQSEESSHQSPHLILVLSKPARRTSNHIELRSTGDRPTRQAPSRHQLRARLSPKLALKCSIPLPYYPNLPSV